MLDNITKNILNISKTYEYTTNEIIKENVKHVLDIVVNCSDKFEIYDKLKQRNLHSIAFRVIETKIIRIFSISGAESVEYIEKPTQPAAGKPADLKANIQPAAGSGQGQEKGTQLKERKSSSEPEKKAAGTLPLSSIFGETSRPVVVAEGTSGKISLDEKEITPNIQRNRLSRKSIKSKKFPDLGGTKDGKTEQLHDSEEVVVKPTPTSGPKASIVETSSVDMRKASISSVSSGGSIPSASSITSIPDPSVFLTPKQKAARERAAKAKAAAAAAAAGMVSDEAQLIITDVKKADSALSCCELPTSAEPKSHSSAVVGELPESGDVISVAMEIADRDVPIGTADLDNKRSAEAKEATCVQQGDTRQVAGAAVDVQCTTEQGKVIENETLPASSDEYDTLKDVSNKVKGMEGGSAHVDVSETVPVKINLRGSSGAAADNMADVSEVSVERTEPPGSCYEATLAEFQSGQSVRAPSPPALTATGKLQCVPQLSSEIAHCLL